MPRNISIQSTLFRVYIYTTNIVEHHGVVYCVWYNYSFHCSPLHALVLAKTALPIQEVEAPLANEVYLKTRWLSVVWWWRSWNSRRMHGHSSSLSTDESSANIIRWSKLRWTLPRSRVKSKMESESKQCILIELDIS